MDKKDHWFIAKVQVSLSGENSTLIYNEDRSWQHICEREFGEGLLGKDIKGYFKMCHKKDKSLYVHSRLPDKNW